MSFSNWIDQLDRDDLEAELKALDHQRKELVTKIELMRQALRLYQLAQDSGVLGEERPSPTVKSRQPAAVGIIAVMKAGDPSRAWKLQEIQAEMVSLGLAKPGGTDRNRLQLAAARLVEKGEIEKASYGHYRLAAPPAADGSIYYIGNTLPSDYFVTSAGTAGAGAYGPGYGNPTDPTIITTGQYPPHKIRG
jgi:hypothetical protein